MSDMHKSTRLGDLLVERGTITRHQLLLAIETQQKRRLESIADKKPENKSELGEVLIELGFINRRQLDSGLSWQQKLRKTTLVMAFVAPLLTAACGGGGSGSANASTNTPSGESSSQSIDPAPGSSSSSPASKQSSSASSSAPASISSSASSASSSSQQTASLDGPVVIYWSVPTYRENGEYLDITEIGGYELRYKLKSAEQYTSVKINNGFTDTYYFDYLEGDYEFEIATYDTNNLYSNFVPINPT